MSTTETISPTSPPPAAATSAAVPPPPARPTPPAVETRSLTKKFGALTALDSLDLTLEPGDVFGFIGPNGAGKSTTMKILAGLLEPTSGGAFVMGRQVAANGDFVRRNVGYMPDFFGGYEDLTVAEYLEFFASAYGVPRKHRKKVVGYVLELTELKYKQDALTDSLSRGMTQRLSLARVLVHDPPVLLLDEPASGLDPRARIEIRELLRQLQKMGKTILVSSHILSELGEFCNKLGIIERGKLIVAGTVPELMQRARAHPVISVHVLGDPAAAISLLRADPRIHEVVPAPPHNHTPQPTSLHGQPTELLVTLRDPTLHHQFLIETLVQHNIPLHSIAPHQLKLEDVFLTLTEGIVQ